LPSTRTIAPGQAMGSVAGRLASTRDSEVGVEVEVEVGVGVEVEVEVARTGPSAPCVASAREHAAVARTAMTTGASVLRGQRTMRRSSFVHCAMRVACRPVRHCANAHFRVEAYGRARPHPLALRSRLRKLRGFCVAAFSV